VRPAASTPSVGDMESEPVMASEPAGGSELALLADHTSRLLTTVGALDHPGTPSRCEGWSRGHVLTHVARNAEAIARLATWALDGTRREMYAGGTRARDEAVEAGAGRPIPQLLEDVRSTGQLVGEALDRLAAGPWAVDRVEMRGGLQVRPAVLPFLRLREVVFHHVDLDAGFGFEDVEGDLLDTFLDDAVPRLRSAAPELELELRSDEGRSWTVGAGGSPVVVTGSRAGILLWLARRDPAGVAAAGGALPELPRGA